MFSHENYIYFDNINTYSTICFAYYFRNVINHLSITCFDSKVLCEELPGFFANSLFGYLSENTALEKSISFDIIWCIEEKIVI